LKSFDNRGDLRKSQAQPPANKTPEKKMIEKWGGLLSEEKEGTLPPKKGKIKKGGRKNKRHAKRTEENANKQHRD